MIRKTNPDTGRPRRAGSRSNPGSPRPDRRRLYRALIGGVIAVAALALVAVVALTTPSSSGSTGQSVVQGRGGSWTNVTPDRLAHMLDSKDFTLLNVKTPYIGEIDGTDLYVPSDQLSARASELPASRNAKVLVYCRSGVESAMAAQTLLDLGYTNVWNLDGGMNAWTSSGRTLIQKNR